MPDPTVTPPKPRRRRAKRPAADPSVPKKPRVTLRSRIEAMGPTHLDAYRILCSGPEFDAALRDALKANADLSVAHDRAVAAVEASRAADAAFDDAMGRAVAARAVLKRLDDLARHIATARGDVPTTDDAHDGNVAPKSDAD